MWFKVNYLMAGRLRKSWKKLKDFLTTCRLSFTADRPLLVDRNSTLSIDWPALLDDDVQLQLVVSGVLVRTTGAVTALRIERHEFRTRRAGHSCRVGIGRLKRSRNQSGRVRSRFTALIELFGPHHISRRAQRSTLLYMAEHVAPSIAQPPLICSLPHPTRFPMRLSSTGEIIISTCFPQRGQRGCFHAPRPLAPGPGTFARLVFFPGLFLLCSVGMLILCSRDPKEPVRLLRTRVAEERSIL